MRGCKLGLKNDEKYLRAGDSHLETKCRDERDFERDERFDTRAPPLLRWLTRATQTDQEFGNAVPQLIEKSLKRANKT